MPFFLDCFVVVNNFCTHFAYPPLISKKAFSSQLRDEKAFIFRGTTLLHLQTYRCTHYFCNGKARFFLLFHPGCSEKELRGELGERCFLPRTIRQVSEKPQTLTIPHQHFFHMFPYYKKNHKISQVDSADFSLFHPRGDSKFNLN